MADAGTNAVFWLGRLPAGDSDADAIGLVGVVPETPGVPALVFSLTLMRLIVPPERGSATGSAAHHLPDPRQGCGQLGKAAALGLQYYGEASGVAMERWRQVRKAGKVSRRLARRGSGFCPV